MRDFLLGLLKSLLVAELLHHAPSMAKAIVRFAARCFIPAPQRHRWAAEWLAELEAKQASSSRLGLLLFALGALKAAPQVGWIEVSHGRGVTNIRVTVLNAVRTWRLRRLMRTLATLDRYALARTDLDLKLKQELAAFLLVPGLWVFCLFHSVTLLGLTQHNPWWWLLLVPEFLYLLLIGPCAFMVCFNRLADSGLLARSVLAYPSSRARLTERISLVEAKLAGEGGQDPELPKRVVMQHEQLMVIGTPSAAPKINHGASHEELLVMNLGPSHLVVQQVVISFRQELAITGDIFLVLAPGETAPLLNQNLVKFWLERFNEEQRWSHSFRGPVSTIDADVTIKVKAAGASGSLEATRAVHLRSDEETFYLWHDTNEGR